MDIHSTKDDDMPIDFQERRTKAMLCPDEVRRLYFNEGLSQKQIAERAGWKTAYPVRRIFNEQGWIPRVQRGGVSPRNFRNDEERRHARSEHKKKSAQRIKDLREKLFGKECGLCGVSKEEKILPVHRKDGTKHEEEALRRMGFLKSLDPEEYVALCTSCHSGAHWLMVQHGMKWSEIHAHRRRKQEAIIQARERIDLPDENTPSSDRYRELQRQGNSNLENLRSALFGESCHFCGTRSTEKKIVVHRKDFRSHNKRLLESKKYLRTLDPDDWAALCNKCHRYTHWAHEILGMDRDDLNLM